MFVTNITVPSLNRDVVSAKWRAEKLNGNILLAMSWVLFVLTTTILCSLMGNLVEFLAFAERKINASKPNWDLRCSSIFWFERKTPRFGPVWAKKLPFLFEIMVGKVVSFILDVNFPTKILTGLTSEVLIVKIEVYIRFLKQTKWFYLQICATSCYSS